MTKLLKYDDVVEAVRNWLSSESIQTNDLYAAINSIPPAQDQSGRIKELESALIYLHEAFENEAWQCENCGHAEETRDMDSAGYLRYFMVRVGLAKLKEPT